jgi:hypothetical protein
MPITVAATGLTSANGVTDSNGSYAFTYVAPTTTVTATSGTLSRSASFAVVGAKISASVLQAVISPGAQGQIDFRLVDVNSNPMVGMPITVAATGLTSANGVTDSNGSYAFTYVAPSTTGTLDITANAGGVNSVQSVIVQAGAGTIPAVTAAVFSASVSANPSVVAVNSGASNNRTEVRALFLAAGNSPIPNVRVKFDLANDPNAVGGALSSADNIVYSDANGVASTSYIPASRSSPTDGLTVRACYYSDDATAALGACATFAAATLTVVSEALAVSIGTNNTISEGVDGLTYIKKYVVLVVDSSGQAKSGVQISPSIDLTHFRTGFYALPGAWTTDPTFGGFSSKNCQNEDVNRNGAAETGEDLNKNGQLDPRKSDVAISLTGGNTTNSSGIVTLQLEYPKNVATWVDFQILVAASGISGTEGRATYIGSLGAAASEFTSQSSPSFMISPYGSSSTRQCDVPPP